MKTKNVVAAIILNKDCSKVFATARGYGEFKGLWEFPGGKIEPGEKPEEAVVREIREELDSLVSVKEQIGTIEYDYPDFHLSMRCFLCELIEGELTLKEAEASVWLSKDHLYDQVKWLPADRLILPEVEKYLSNSTE